MDGAIGPTRHKLDAETYHRMVEAGVFGHEDRIELIDGELMDMAPTGQDHVAIVGGLTEALVVACVGKALVLVQCPINIDPRSEPEPDFSVLRLRAGGYRTGPRAAAGDALLLAEVSNSSLKFDRSVKLPLYARAGIPEFWIVDVPRNVVEVYRGPVGDGYSGMQTVRAGDVVMLVAEPGISVRLPAVLG